MLDKILNAILIIGLPYVVISYSFSHFGTSAGFGAMILCFVFLFLYFKPKIYTIIARQKYLSNHDECFKFMEKAHKSGRMNPQDALVYAYLLLRDGHITKAERLINGTLHQKRKKLSEQNILAADLNTAIILWKKNDLPGAIEKMEEVYSTGYRSTVLYQTLGIFYLLNGDLEKAEDFIAESVDYNGDDASIRDNEGLLHIKKGEFEKAKEVYDAIFEEGAPDFIEANYNYGYTLEQLGDLDGACKYYKKALGCPERYLSTVKMGLVELALTRAEEKIG